MAATKECPSCGAQNDIIFTNCIFCKTALPQIDPNSISNDELIMMASEWVGKSCEASLVIHGPDANEWTGKGIVIMMQGEIVGNAEKYLNLLAIRSTSSPTLGVLYQNLKSTLVNNLKQANSTRRRPIKIIIGLTIFLISIFILIIVLDSNDQTGEKNEQQRLNTIELKIEESIKNKDYDRALILANQLNWTWKIDLNASKEKAGQYDNKRKEYRNTINSLKNK